jgi:hypothetical protein
MLVDEPIQLVDGGVASSAAAGAPRYLAWLAATILAYERITSFLVCSKAVIEPPGGC